MTTKQKNRNYIATEKQLFVKILQKYARTVENKKSSASSLQEKEEAWEAICEEYNASSIVTEQRSVKQLKKLWTNLKQAQRDALTKEKQSRFLTGGGPPAVSASVDPEISMIVPNLIATAPTLFSSSLDEETLKLRENEVVLDNTDEILLEILDEENTHEPTEDARSCAIQGIGLLAEQVNDAAEVDHPASQVGQSGTNHPRRASTLSSTSTTRKSKRASSIHDLDAEEKELKTRRLLMIMEHESEMFCLKKSQEEKLYELAKAKSVYDLRAAKAAAELAEMLLAKEKNK